MAFKEGGDLGELITLRIFPGTVGSGSKGGMAYDNKTLDKNNKIVSAKEVKFVSLNGTKTCKNCKQKCPYFQTRCINTLCKSTNFKYNSDSRASISSKTHYEPETYKLVKEYIIYVQDYNENTNTISIKCYKFLCSNIYFDKYIRNQYDKNKGTCNFVPYSFDWYMSGPITILDVSINISNNEPEVEYHKYDPQSEIHDDVEYDKFKKILYSNEKKILDETKLINGFFKYNYIKDKFKLRSKSIGKLRGHTKRK